MIIDEIKCMTCDLIESFWSRGWRNCSSF